VALAPAADPTRTAVAFPDHFAVLRIQNS
jgi:hypothetical protein